MNCNALLRFGYHNAFVVFPLVLQCIPIGTTPFLFISEDFFEDLSSSEQRFLIGHEMVHIKKQHFRYLNLFLYMLFIALLLIGFLIQRYINRRHQELLIYITFSLLLCICLLTPKLVAGYYRKNKEREADYLALSTLQAHNGCMALLSRWHHEFGVSLHNPCYGLFADHPSIHERKMYCLALK